MAYIASSDVKAWGGIPATDAIDDDELTLLIARAEAYVEEYTGRVFKSDSDAESTRNFSASRDVEGQTLWLDQDLNTVVSITAGTDSISSSDYVTEPRNDSPYYALTLKAESSLTWDEPTSDGDYENAISISGQWAYSSDVPKDIEWAMVGLVKWLYNRGRMSDASAARASVLESGAVMSPAEVPRDIQHILNRYRYMPVRS